MTRPELRAAAVATLKAIKSICKACRRCDDGCPFNTWCGVRAPSGLRTDEIENIADNIAIRAEEGKSDD